MVRIKVRAIGKVKESFIREAIAEYSRRLSSYCQIDCTEYPEVLAPDNHSASITLACSQEGEKLCQGIGSDEYVVALDQRGRHISSEGFADMIRRCELMGPYTMYISSRTSWSFQMHVEKSGYFLSLSNMTLPTTCPSFLYEQCIGHLPSPGNPYPVIKWCCMGI
jgi:23S rRNA (pseudouridine1915-N3)-methyltransferase